MTCAACKSRVKDWHGDDAKCSFEGGGEFSRNGWNCATANMIRDLCKQDEPDSICVYCDDQYYATIKLPDGSRWLALWVSWYKHRGATDAMWLLDSHDVPRKPTEAECLEIIAALKETA